LDKKIAFSVLGFALLAIVVLLILPSGRKPETNPLYPWVIEVLPNGSTKVLGLTLGKSSMEDARQTFENDGEINLFASPDKKLSLEGYFNRMIISNIKADVILSLSLDNATLETMYKRGARINNLGNGIMKVSLASADMQTSSNAVIQRITYLPAAHLDWDLVEKRFGTPASVIKEKNDVEHWLYPKVGLDVALNPDGKAVFQYVMPAKFDAITQPLLDEAKEAK
jgi:hypothetical protein